MNIIFISRLPYPIGMAGTKRIRLFAEYLVRKGVIVKVIITGKSNKQNNISGSYNNVEYNYFKKNNLLYIFGLWEFYKLLNYYLKNNSKNYIYIYNGIDLTNILFVIIAKLMGFAIITDIVEDYSFHDEETSFRFRLLIRTKIFFDNHLQHLSDYIIVISKHLKKKYTRKGIPQDKIRLIPISAENLMISIKEPILRDKTRFVYSGSFNAKDGIQNILKAFKQLSATYSNIELILSGPNKRIPNEYFNTYFKEDNIEYVGLIPNTSFYEFLSDSDALLSTRVNTTYANAGFPFKLGEYLATGNPVITTNISDITTYLTDKIDVIIVKPNNVNSLVEAMKFIIDNKVKSKNIGINGKETASKHFNPIINGQKLFKFLNHN